MRVYRYRPFLFWSVVPLVMVASTISALIWPVGVDRDFEYLLKAVPIGLLALAFGAFLVLMWRVRTVIDETGVTQHWISRSYRVSFDEITAVETDLFVVRWFLRVQCGEETAEFFPCFVIRPMGGAGGVPPRALRAFRREIEQRCAAIAT
jgi:hypothetical protein